MKVISKIRNTLISVFSTVFILFATACDKDEDLTGGHPYPTGVFVVDNIFYNIVGKERAYVINPNQFKDLDYDGEIYIPDEVFIEGNQYIESGTYPVIGITGRTFRNCVNMSSIRLPEHLTHIQHNAFENCTGLTNIIIPGDVENIGSATFKGCSNLYTIILSKSLYEIGSETFEGCVSLRHIYCPADKPPKINNDNSFPMNVFQNATLYVPSESIHSYEETIPWNQFSNIKALPKNM